MLILTMEETFGISSAVVQPPIKERTVAFATNLSLGRAISRIKEYEKAYREAFASSRAYVEFRLLSVSEIDREFLTYDLLESVGVTAVEKLAKTPEQIRSTTETG